MLNAEATLKLLRLSPTCRAKLISHKAFITIEWTRL